jgi:hypothetical protein
MSEEASPQPATEPHPKATAAEKRRAINNLRQRKWRAANPERYQEHITKWSKTVSNRLKMKQAARKVQNRLVGRTVTTYLERNIKHHIMRGRGLADIVCWLELPVSVLKPIYDKLAIRNE